MQNETTSAETTLKAFVPVKLKASVKKKILEKIAALSFRRRATGERFSPGFIQIAVPFGVAALFLAMSSSHALMAAGYYSLNATRHVALVNCATQQVDGGRIEWFLPAPLSASNEVADAAGRTNGFDVVGRSRGRTTGATGGVVEAGMILAPCGTEATRTAPRSPRRL